MLSILVVYHVGKRLLDQRTGLIAALFLAFSPFMVYFAQDARAYSWMVFTTLLSVYTFVRIISSLSAVGRATRLEWIAFACASAAMLYTHFLSLWGFIIAGVYFLVFWWKWRRGFRGFVLAGFGTVLLFSPWIMLLLGVGSGNKSFAGTRQIGGIQTDAPIASLLWIWQEGLSTHGGISLGNTLKQALVSFTVGDFIPSGWDMALTSVVTFVTGVGLVALAVQRKTAQVDPVEDGEDRPFPYPILFLLLYALLPVLLSFFVAFPTSRPHWAKYFMMALPAYVLMIGAGLSALWQWHKAAGILSSVIVIAISLFGLYNYFENPVYARADIRPGVAYLEAFSAPTDALLANPPASSPPFWFYYRGDLPHYVPAQIDEALLDEIKTKHSGLWVVQNTPVGFDPDETIEKWLTYRTYRTFTEWVGQLIFRYYSMPSEGEPVLQQKFDVPIEFGDSIALQSYQVRTQTSGRAQILQLELAWKATSEIDENYMVAARVVDDMEQVWGQANSAPLGNFRPTSSWQSGEVILDHLGLLLWPGTPPGHYSVQLWMYREANGSVLTARVEADGQLVSKVNLGEIAVESPEYPPAPAVLGMSDEVGRELSGLLLLGYQSPQAVLKPGDTLEVLLFWQSLWSPLPQYKASLWLEDSSGHRWGEMSATVGGGFSTDRWPSGQIVRDPYRLLLAPNVPEGAYAARLTLADELGFSSSPTRLFKLDIRDRVRRFDLPQIPKQQKANLANRVELLGYDLPSSQISPGQTLPLTLYWRALAPMDTSFTVFNHLVGSSSELVGQWDGVPSQGMLPTTEWVQGEIIEDVYHIPVWEDTSPGIYHLLVGMYDPITGNRLQTVAENGKDYVRLDSQVEIR